MLGQSALQARVLCSSQNVFLSYGSTKITCRNTLLNDSDDRRFVSPTCFHCQYYCISLCVQPVTYYTKWILAYFVSLFTILMNSKNFKNGIMGHYITQAIHLPNKLGVNFPVFPAFKFSVHLHHLLIVIVLKQLLTYTVTVYILVNIYGTCH